MEVSKIRYLAIKNYRNFENITLNLEPLTILVGDNNTGKTSLMKLISSFSNIKTLDFKETVFYNISCNDIISSPKKDLEIFLGFFEHRAHNKKKNNIFFEKFKIKKLENYKFPLVSQLYTVDYNRNLAEISFSYKSDNANDIERELTLKTIKFRCFKFDDLNNVNDFNEDENWNDKLEKIVSTNKPLWEKKIDYKDFDINQKESFNNYHSFEEHKTLWEKQFSFLNFWTYNIFNSINLSQANQFSISEIYNLYAIQDTIVKIEKILNQKSSKTDQEIKKVMNKFWEGFNPGKNKIRWFNNFNTFKYIDPLRPTFEEYYSSESFDNNLVSINDKLLLESIKELKNNKNLNQKTNIFLQEISNIEEIKINEDIMAKEEKTFYFPVFKIKGSNTYHKLKYSGTGISQLLPILITVLEQGNRILSSRKSKSICIEQPEIHLHPKAQNKFAELLINDYLLPVQNLNNNLERNDSKKQKNKEKNVTTVDYFNSQENLILETHSSFIIDSLRESIKNINKSNTKKDNTLHINSFLNIIYLYNNNKKISRDIFGINEQGRFCGKYENYIDFYLNDSLKLISV